LRRLRKSKKKRLRKRKRHSDLWYIILNTILRRVYET
jgi:hypothetical protein